MRRLPIILWLVAVWVALWGELTVANVLSGTLVAVAVSRTVPTSEGPLSRIRLGALVRFEVHFLRKLIEATLVVAWETVTPRNRLVEGIVRVPITGSTPFVAFIVANSVSLTPGTVTLAVEDDRSAIYVHVLHLRDIEAVRREVQQLEALAVAVFGGPAPRSPRGTSQATDELIDPGG